MPIKAENIEYIYDRGTPFETATLKGVSFTVADGGFVGIMGHTGCGKSTLIQLLAGLLTPSAGTILIDGMDINSREYDRSELRQKIGIVFQYPESQLFESTVYKDIAFGLKYSGLSEKEKDERIRWALEVTGFEYDKIIKKSPMGLSGGEKRWVAIAGVLAVKPKYLILDEPVAGLDPAGREKFMSLVGELNDGGMTVMMISHDADCISEFTDRVLILEDGKIAVNDETRKAFTDIECLKALGIGAGRSREIVDKLRQKGFDISEEIVSYRELLPALADLLSGGDVV